MTQTEAQPASGPLAGLRIVEFAGQGPAPFCGMLLSDLGADVIRIDRPGPPPQRRNLTERGRRSVILDMKDPGGLRTGLQLIERADALIEGFRPGVMERLGIGPDVALERNPRLVYGRMTGWGQTGPYALAAGHDINYIAISGVLGAIGTPERPIQPLNLVGDFGGGALYLALGVVSAVLAAQRTGRGQVVDAAMVDGAASLMTPFYGLRAEGRFGPRGSNRIDGAAPFYGVYQCADGEWIAAGAIERQFYALLCQKLGLEDGAADSQDDRDHWPQMKDRIAAIVSTRTRDAWMALFEGTDCCVSPVLSLDEALSHPQNTARGVFVEHDGVLQPAPAPRFSVTPGAIQRPAPHPGQHGDEVLRDWGIHQDAP